MMRFEIRRSPFLILSVMLVVAGCGQPVGRGTESSTGARPQTAADLETVLARADRADGQADHVVAQCAGCGLGMPGDAEYAQAVQGYELHFCSDQCKQYFTEDIEESLLALSLPDEAGAVDPSQTD